MTNVLPFNPGHGALLRDRGVGQVTAYNRNFVVLMREIARQISLANGCVNSDQLREIAERRGIKPRHPNAWGAVFHDRHWMRVGYKTSSVASNRARQVSLWKWIDLDVLDGEELLG